jgi:hypothetical protein
MTINAYEWADITILCSHCGSEVDLLKDELEDGEPPKHYLCAECE